MNLADVVIYVPVQPPTDESDPDPTATRAAREQAAIISAHPDPNEVDPTLTLTAFTPTGPKVFYNVPHDATDKLDNTWHRISEN